MRLKTLSAFALALAMSGAYVRAEDKPATPAPAPAPTTPETPAPAPAPAPTDGVIDIKDADALKEAVGKQVTVRGKVRGFFTPSNGAMLINFDGVPRGGPTGIIEKVNVDAVKAGFKGDIETALKGKTVLVTGLVKLYKERPEVEVSTPDQIKVQEADAEKKEEEKK
jgi:hypothetical protein